MDKGRSTAAHSINQSFKGGVYGEKPPSSDSEEEETDDFKDKQVAELFKSVTIPPFAEWKPAHHLTEAAPTFERFLAPKKRGERKRPRVYFYTTHIDDVFGDLRQANAAAVKKFSIWPTYGSSPDKPTGVVVTAAGCARMIVRSVSKDYEMCEAIFSTAMEFLGLDGSKQLVYRGLSLIHI